ncbi:hypothetical protein GCM10010412_044500 [Nonomuraea recticatena]|uniref:Condensation domain-containing protein n=3 Tax=Nonomuraea TaxID=83681 RepID=A0ABN3S3I9_9ACTN
MITEVGGESVEFTGERVAGAPLTWGQQSIWHSTRWLEDGDPYFNLPWVLPVHGRRDLKTVLSALGALLDRHESLRTTWEDTPRGPVQQVKGHGELRVEVVEAAEVKPRQAAATVAAELAATGFDYARELPLRCSVVCDSAGRPGALAFALTHFAVDGWALDLLAAEWRALLTGRPLPAPLWHPLDQAAFEQGEGAARGARSLRYWREAMDRAPATLFGERKQEPERPRFVKVGMESAALAAAAEILAARWAVSTTSVLVAATAVLLGEMTGQRDIALQFIVGNRHDPRMRAMVGTAVQDGLFVLAIPDGHVADAARAAHASAMAAYRHAHYDPAEQRALRDEPGRPDLSAYFNDVRSFPGWPNRPRGHPAELTGRTRTFHAGAWDEVDASFFLSTGPATDTCQLYLLTDTARLSRAAAEAMLRAIETLLVTSVTRDVPLAGIGGLGIYEETR